MYLPASSEATTRARALSRLQIDLIESDESRLERERQGEGGMQRCREMRNVLDGSAGVWMSQ